MKASSAPYASMAMKPVTTIAMTVTRTLISCSLGSRTIFLRERRLLTVAHGNEELPGERSLYAFAQATALFSDLSDRIRHAAPCGCVRMRTAQVPPGVAKWAAP
jgi:hypothetical protein